MMTTIKMLNTTIEKYEIWRKSFKNGLETETIETSSIDSLMNCFLLFDQWLINNHTTEQKQHLLKIVWYHAELTNVANKIFYRSQYKPEKISTLIQENKKFIEVSEKLLNELKKWQSSLGEIS